MAPLDLALLIVKAVPVAIWLACGPLGAFLLYRSLYPKPLPGIPIGYPEGLDHVPWLVGFGPAFGKTVRKEGGFMPFFHPAVARYGPVWQMPFGPAGTWLSRLTGFGQILVVCADSQEIEDACSRRAAAFGKSRQDNEPFRVAVPTSQLALLSGLQHRHHRRVFGPSMSRAYLSSMVPRIEDCVDHLVSLWKARTTRARMQDGKPIEVLQDLMIVANDIINDLVFGKTLGGIDGMLKHLDTAPSNSPPDSSPPAPRFMECMRILMALVTTMSLPGPLGPLFTFYYRNISSRTRRARQHIIEVVETRIAAERALRNSDGPRDWTLVPRDAVHVLGMALDAEEAHIAKGTAPLPQHELRDELLTYIIAGSEAVPSTIAWAVKFLSRSPEVQHRLRAELAERLPSALHPNQSSGENSLNFDQLSDEATLPYITATVYESFRLSHVGGLTVRTTMCDTTVLGYPVPTGTRVAFLTAWVQAAETERHVRDEEDRAAKEGRQLKHGRRKWGCWADDVAEFRPERWLTRRPDGSTEFDRTGGPWLPFGAGPRACFGRHLAILEVKVFIVKLISQFCFEAVPASLDDDSAIEVPARRPLQCYVRLTPLD